MLILLLSAQTGRAKAQIPIIDIIGDAAKAIVMALDLKVQELQTEAIGLQEAQQALENSLHLSELGDIAGWLQQQKDLYAGYYNELWQVKTMISTYERVEDMISKEATIVAEVRQLNTAIGQDPHLTVSEVGSMGTTLAGILQASAQNLGQIQQVITALVTQMDDADRLAIIDVAGNAIDRNYSDLQVFGQRGLVLSLNRARDANDVAAVKALWGLR